ncbi:hypothetical protein AHF37_10397, partial [Paragonimus kellicotti]
PVIPPTSGPVDLSPSLWTHRSASTDVASQIPVAQFGSPSFPLPPIVQVICLSLHLEVVQNSMSDDFVTAQDVRSRVLLNHHS